MIYKQLFTIQTLQSKNITPNTFENRKRKLFLIFNTEFKVKFQVHSMSIQ